MVVTSSTPTLKTGRPRLLLVDDDPVVLDLLATWFTRRGYDVCKASNGIKALAHSREATFDVVVTDLDMPGLDGLQLLGVYKELAPETEVIILSGRGNMETAIAALREGRAFDFLIKPVDSLSQLEGTVTRALARRATLLASRMAGAASVGGAIEPRPALHEPLTQRELEILALLVNGLDNRQIADHLFLSWKTVKNNLTRVYEKLQVTNRTQAVLACQRHGLI